MPTLNDDIPDVTGAPASAGDSDIVIEYAGKQIRFAPFGGKIEARLRTGQFYESEMLQYIEALGLPGTYVDVGGYVGTHALYFATYCKADHVHTFEPRKRCHEHLTRNIGGNSLGDRVTAHRVGLSDRQEMFSLRMERVTEEIECRPLDDLIHTPVSVMKIDVEGMEPQVLRGASRILATHRPLLFIEAHTDEELRKDLEVLAPYDYRPTGRVFNASATYELAAPGSPTVGENRLPRRVGLLDRELWHPDPGLHLEWARGKLIVRSRLGEGVQAHVSQLPSDLRRPPRSPIATPPTPCFIQVRGQLSTGLKAVAVVMVYSSRLLLRDRRVAIRHHIHPQLVGKVDLPQNMDRIRIALRLEGPGTLEIDELSLHVFANAAIKE